MPKRVLIFTTEMIPGLGYPIAGGGIRAWQIAEGLKSRGYEVLYSIPVSVTKGKNNLPKEITDFTHSYEDLNSVVYRTQPDIIVCTQWHSANRLKTPLSVPLVLDLFGLRVLEDAYLNNFDLEPFFASKIEALSKGDFFICATDMQKAYFLPWLIMAGIDPKENCLCSIPVSLSPQLPILPDKKDSVFVYGGVFWPWQNPFPALNAVLSTMEKLNQGKLKIYGSKHPYWSEFPGPYPDPKKELVSTSRVEFIDMLQHEDLMKEYLQASVAIDLPSANNERFLAFPIRTVCYLWSGLPLLVSDFSPLARDIEKYEAGWVLNQKDKAGISKTVESIIGDPTETFRRGRNAQKMVSSELTWDKTITPLDEYCQNPRKIEKKDLLIKRMAEGLAESNRERGRLGAELKNVWEILNQTRDELRVASQAVHDLSEIRNKPLFKLYKKIKGLFH